MSFRCFGGRKSSFQCAMEISSAEHNIIIISHRENLRDSGSWGLIATSRAVQQSARATPSSGLGTPRAFTHFLSPADPDIYV